MKSAEKARNNGLYRHIRTSKEIIRNLLNDLGNYIVWHNFVNFAHDSRENKEEIMLNYAIKYPMTETNAMIPNRPATP